MLTFTRIDQSISFNRFQIPLHKLWLDVVGQKRFYRSELMELVNSQHFTGAIKMSLI